MFFQNLLQDLHYAARQLLRAPGFALTVVLTLALSVGVATAVFCVFNTVMLQPLPFTHPEKIVNITSYSRSGYQQPYSWPSFKDARAQAQTFDAMATYAAFAKINLETPSNGSVSLDCVRSTDNFFQVFGMQPILGRTYASGEEQEGKNDVVVLSFEAWQGYFGGDRGVLNKTVKLDGRSFTVIGVMPAGFRYPLNMRNAVYIPRLVIDEAWMNDRDTHWLLSVARFKDGLSIEQAQADLDHVFDNLGRAYPETDGDRTVRLEPLAASVLDLKTQGKLWTLLGAALAVLAIGCVNVAGLLLARGIKREREMAMRAAIGAGRKRMILQVITEGLLLAVLGAGGGVLLASLLIKLMSNFLILALLRGADIHLDWKALAAAIAISVIASLAASLYPALRLSAIDPNHVLKAGGSAAGTEQNQHRLRSGFMVTQIALTLVLLVVAGLLMRVVSRYRHADLGFDPSHILSVKISLSKAKYQGRDPISAIYQPLEERVSNLPGVKAAGLIDMMPIKGHWTNSDIHIAGQPPNPPGQVMLAEQRFVSKGYFDAMGIPLHRGRWLSPGLDRAENITPTVVVNDAFVREFIPDTLDPTAQRIDSDSHKQEEWGQIVGVTGNARQSIKDDPMAERDYLMDELDLKARADLFANMYLLVRTSGDPRQLIPAIRSSVHDLDPTVPFEEPQTMSEVISESLVSERMQEWLFGIFAALALVLALVGIYGLASQEVEMATRDIGVRLALGATRGRILGMVLARIAWMLGAGAVVGLLLSAAARKVIEMVIVFDAQQEAGGLLLLALLLVAAGLIAALIPAVRAASIEPMQALRSE
ncbi:MAG: ABC transporter permease [Terracidiphilus sp.]